MKMLRIAGIGLIALTTWVCIPVLAQDLNLDDLLSDLDAVEETEEPVADEAVETDAVDEIVSDVVEEEPEPDMEEPEPEPVEAADPVMAAEPMEEPAVEPVEEAPQMAVEEPMDEPAVESVDETPEMVAEAVVADKPLTPEEERARTLAIQQEIKLQADEETAMKHLNLGIRAFSEDKNEKAVEHFTQALDMFPDRPGVEELLIRARLGRAEANYRIAEKYLDSKDFAAAREALQAVKEDDAEHKKLEGLEKRIAKAEARVKEEKASVVAQLSEQLEARDKTVEQRIDEAKQLMKRGEYETAEALLDEALVRDPYNRNIMALLRNIEERRYRVHTFDRKTTRADMMDDVRKAWASPLQATDLFADDADDDDGATGGERFLQAKMEKIIIPSIKFRQGNIVDVINHLQEESVKADTEEGVGVNIILNLNRGDGGGGGGGMAAPQVVDDPWAGIDSSDMGAGMDMGGGGGGLSGIPTITLSLTRVSLLDAIKYVTEVAGLKYRLDEKAVIITDPNTTVDPMFTRFYEVEPSFIDVIVQEDEQDRGGDFIEMGRSKATSTPDVQEFFMATGVQFPEGSSITYRPSISKLIVNNTADNLEVLERVLAELNVIPTQVEIEARFVEVGQNDLEELGFEWLLTDDWELAVKEGPGSIAAKERVVMGANNTVGGLTHGLRFFDFSEVTGKTAPRTRSTGVATDTMLGNMLRITSVLTNPEVSMILHALDQKGATDLLSAPRVTTKSSEPAVIEVVEEIIYPTEFETEPPTFGDGGELQTPPVVTPGAFETREVGVILNVTPTVSPNGKTIDLVMIPEVAELVDWLDYGSSIGDFNYFIPQPIFSSRNVRTRISIQDGATVVMGGLIREELTEVDDKIPLLGDIPIIGRLFRNEGELSSKQNLMIFVTARLVDSAGKVLREKEQMSDVMAATAAAK